MSDYDREQWQAEQEAQTQAQTAYRDKMAKARERSARNAKRKIARLHAKLTELGHISDFEDEFGESVLERLEKFGSAFHDLEKGRAGDALSIAQRQVVARMNKKVKDLKNTQKISDAQETDPDADYVRTADRWKNENAKKSSFRSKRKPGFTPRVRNIEDEIAEDEPMPPCIESAPPNLALVTDTPQPPSLKPYIPEYTPPSKPTAAKRPFLRIVPNIVESNDAQKS